MAVDKKKEDGKGVDAGKPTSGEYKLKSNSLGKKDAHGRDLKTHVIMKNGAQIGQQYTDYNVAMNKLNSLRGKKETEIAPKGAGRVSTAKSVTPGSKEDSKDGVKDGKVRDNLNAKKKLKEAADNEEQTNEIYDLVAEMVEETINANPNAVGELMAEALNIKINKKLDARKKTLAKDFAKKKSPNKAE